MSCVSGISASMMPSISASFSWYMGATSAFIRCPRSVAAATCSTAAFSSSRVRPAAAPASAAARAGRPRRPGPGPPLPGRGALPRCMLLLLLPEPSFAFARPPLHPVGKGILRGRGPAGVCFGRGCDRRGLAAFACPEPVPPAPPEASGLSLRFTGHPPSS